MLLIASHHGQVSVKVIFVQIYQKYFLKMLIIFVQNAKCISSQLKEIASKINVVDCITPRSGLGHIAFSALTAGLPTCSKSVRMQYGTTTLFSVKV